MCLKGGNQKNIVDIYILYSSCKYNNQTQIYFRRGREIFGVFHVKNHDFTQKKFIFLPILGGGCKYNNQTQIYFAKFNNTMLCWQLKWEIKNKKIEKLTFNTCTRIC
jgi:hypothetical protein